MRLSDSDILVFTSQMDEKYVSRLKLTVNLVPPFYDHYTFNERGPRLVLNDLIAKLHSRNNFIDFERSESVSSLSVEDITDIVTVNGNEFSKPVTERFIILSPGYTSDVEFSIFTRDETKLTELYSYIMFTSNALKNRYIERHTEFLELINQSTENTPRIFTANPAMLSFSANKSPLIVVTRPTLPEKIGTRRLSVIFICFLLGLMSGMVTAFYKFEKDFQN